MSSSIPDNHNHNHNPADPDDPRHHQPPPLPLLRPRPRRPFEISNSPSPTPTADAFSAQLHARLSSATDSRSSTPAESESVRRNRSILNLTASTLFGIYAPTATGGSGAETPWGTGAETPGLPAAGGGGAPLRERHGGGGSGVLEWEVLRERLGFGGSGGNNGARRAEEEEEEVEVDVDVPAEEVVEEEEEEAVAAAAVPPEQRSTARRVAAAAARAVALFGFGVVYGLMIGHLHDSRGGVVRGPEGIDRAGWRYLVFWGVAGVVVGSALPWVDLVWEGGRKVEDETGKQRRRLSVGRVERRRSSVVAREAAAGQEWNDVVRSVGAFVGIAFAIRKLPWQSTLQVSLTLALVNPALWYLLDRSKPGFTLSMLVGLSGTAIMLLLGQHADSVPFIPSPPIVGGVGPNSSVRLGGPRGGVITPAAAATAAANGTTDYESTVGVATWFASVLFCSCVCFGNIGRKLAIQG